MPSASRRGRTCVSNMAYISDGTPGMAASQQLPSASRYQVRCHVRSGWAVRRLETALALGCVPASFDCGGETSPRSAAAIRRSRPARLRPRAPALARQIVLCRSQSAGGEHQTGPSAGDTKCLDIRIEIVGDSGVPADSDADFRQPPAQPLTVGVKVLPAGQLAADGKNFALHSWSASLRRSVIAGRRFVEASLTRKTQRVAVCGSTGASSIPCVTDTVLAKIARCRQARRNSMTIGSTEIITMASTTSSK